MKEIPRAQSGVIPYRVDETGGLEILLITSRRTGEWQVPKGNLEPDLTERDSAAKEGWEEAGVRGQTAEEPVGAYTYQRRVGMGRVELYPMEVSEVASEWEEKGQRERQWFRADEALKKVQNEELRGVLKRFVESKDAGSAP